MQYKITPQASRKASLPHSVFILNLIIVHIFAAYTMLEIGYGTQVMYIPLVSLLVLSVLWWLAQRKAANDDWFVAAHWRIMTGRTKMLIIFYAAGIVLGGFTYLMVGMSPLKGNDMMTIALRMGAVPIFLGLLVTFVLSAGSIWDAQHGIVPQKIINIFPPPTDLIILSTAEGAGSDEAHANRGTHQ